MIARRHPSPPTPPPDRTDVAHAAAELLAVLRAARRAWERMTPGEQAEFLKETEAVQPGGAPAGSRTRLPV